MSQTPPQILFDLIDRFERNIESYRSPAYNEAQVRQEFINPFFEALGWDVANKEGSAEAYKDVIHEDAIKVGAPDYCFRIGGARKFFLEAKKPAVNIKEDPDPAYQLRRYAWSAKLPLSILTDFEEFAVYDCRTRPNPSDKASAGRIHYLTYKEYATRWDEIAAVFSKDAVLTGSFDKYAVSERKRGTTTVDTEFLAEIENWRDALARNLAVRNTALDVHELNFAVQRTIDRLIFLRICEDRGIEPYAQLQALLNGENIYGRLRHLYDQADDRYNSGLFHFRSEKERAETPDELTPKLKIDDKVLKDIIHGLYYPESPYEFSVMPAEILGQVYEQFLGKVIRLTSGHQAKVEEKPEVKKAGGVYYTPAYIVAYIVRNTVGKLCEGKTPKQIAGVGARRAVPLRILDPACGSGSFLIGAYDYLVAYHRDWYLKDGAEKHTKELYQGAGSLWHLTTQEKKRILLNNIYGVDIDSQAVEVTKLSLLLKVLEGENQETLKKQLKMWHERALPDLGRNIKCGNSLIGPDYFSGQLLPDDDEMRRVNPFDWNAEFPEIFTQKSPSPARREAAPKSPSPLRGEGEGGGGFDAVIGNPPYVRIQGFPGDQIEYFSKRYSSTTGNYDLYVNFVERGYELLNSQGRLGFILPNKFFKTDYGVGLRKLLSEAKAVAGIVDFGSHQVFDATTYTCLLFLAKSGGTPLQYAEAEASPNALASLKFKSVSSSNLGTEPWIFAAQEVVALFAKLRKTSKRLLDLPAEMSRGSSSGDDEVFVLENKNVGIEQELLRIPLFASDFGRYRFSPSDKWRIIFPYTIEDGSYRLLTEKELKRAYPKAYTYLQAHNAALRRRKQFKEWFGYSAPRNLELHDCAQIAVPLLANRGLFVLIPAETRGMLCPMASGGFTITISDQCPMRPEYILALLNSRLLFWRLQQESNVFRGGWITCTKQYFGELPVRIINFSDKSDKAKHDKMVALAERMLDLHKRLAKAKAPDDKTKLQRQIDATDQEIDRLVYDLYGLAEEEIGIVESPKG